MLKTAELGLAALAAIAAFGTLASQGAAPSRPVLSQTAPAAGKVFGRICKANESAETRSYPVWVGQSFAQDNCVAPTMPAVVDGLTASRPQIVAGMAAAKRYAVLAESFQQCVGTFMAAQRAEAKRGNKPVNMSVAVIESHRVLASSDNTKKIAAQTNAAINAFNEYGSGCTG